MYGKILKKIRKLKGFTQKEVYSGVVSKTFYSDFEAGKYSVSIEKFEGLLENLGISYEEFDYYRIQDNPNTIKQLSIQIDELYKEGQFEELYTIYETNYSNGNKEIRYLAVKAYLLVLITHSNFYKFSREPFNEIATDLEKTKMWTLNEIRLAKLILLSMSEKDKNESKILFNRIIEELKKYQIFDSRIYFEEIGDLYFNKIQSLLIINDIKSSQDMLENYTSVIQKSDDVHLLIQLMFIKILVGLYLNHPRYENEINNFLGVAKEIPASECHFL